MFGTQIHKAWLDDFWSNFGGSKNLGYEYKKKKKQEQLLRLSQVVIEYKSQSDRAERRKQFDKIKRKRHNLRTHEPCFVCFEKATARHHIILLKNGGINCKKNLVSLCDTCHSDIHPWLKTN